MVSIIAFLISSPFKRQYLLTQKCLQKTVTESLDTPEHVDSDKLNRQNHFFLNVILKIHNMWVKLAKLAKIDWF
jgi:hypothetical protein